MFSNWVRIVLITSFVALAVLGVIQGRYVPAALELFAAGIILYGYWRQSTAWLTFRAVSRNDIDAAKRLAAQTRHPSALGSQMRAYYEWSLAEIATHDGRADDARRHFECALEHRLRTDNDRGVVELQLARILAAQGDAEAAREPIARARTRSLNPAALSLLDETVQLLGGPAQQAHRAERHELR